MESRKVEIAVGMFIAAGIAALFMLAMKVSNLSAYNIREGYEVEARFDNIGGLTARAPVTMAGVRVGRVTSISFDQDTYEAIIKMNIDPRFDKIPADSSASILTSGLLGEQSVGLEPGAEEKFLRGGDEIKFTQSALIMERLVGQLIFNKAQEGDTP